MNTMNNKVTLYVGLNDQHTRKQEIATIEAYKLVSRELVCVGGGTIYEADGVYTHNDGTVIAEKTLRVEISDADDAQVIGLVRKLKMILNQETIICQRETVNTCFM